MKTLECPKLKTSSSVKLKLNDKIFEIDCFKKIIITLIRDVLSIKTENDNVLFRGKLENLEEVFNFMRFTDYLRFSKTYQKRIFANFERELLYKCGACFYVVMDDTFIQTGHTEIQLENDEDGCFEYIDVDGIVGGIKQVLSLPISLNEL